MNIKRALGLSALVAIAFNSIGCGTSPENRRQAHIDGFMTAGFDSVQAVTNADLLLEGKIFQGVNYSLEQEFISYDDLLGWPDNYNLIERKSASEQNNLTRKRATNYANKLEGSNFDDHMWFANKKVKPKEVEAVWDEVVRLVRDNRARANVAISISRTDYDVNDLEKWKEDRRAYFPSFRDAGMDYEQVNEYPDFITNGKVHTLWKNHEISGREAAEYDVSNTKRNKRYGSKDIMQSDELLKLAEGKVPPSYANAVLALNAEYASAEINADIVVESFRKGYSVTEVEEEVRRQHLEKIIASN